MLLPFQWSQPGAYHERTRDTGGGLIAVLMLFLISRVNARGDV